MTFYCSHPPSQIPLSDFVPPYESDHFCSGPTIAGYSALGQDSMTEVFDECEREYRRVVAVCDRNIGMIPTQIGGELDV